MFDVRVLARPYLMTRHFPNPCEFANSKSSCPELACKKDAPENSTKCTGKHFCQSLFFKRETLAQVFSCEFWEIFKKIFFYRTPMVAAPAIR